MSNYFWLVVLPNINAFLSFPSLIGLIICVTGMIVAASAYASTYDNEERKNCVRIAKILVKASSFFVLCLFVTCFIPSKQEIIQLKVISVASELNGVDKIPQKLVDKLNDVLDGDKND